VWLRADYPHIASLGIEQAFTTFDVDVTTVWQRFSYTKTITVAGGLYVDIVPGRYSVDTGTLYVSDAQLILNDRYRTNEGAYLNPSDQAIDKPVHDLAPNNAPTRALADVEGKGNRLTARDFDATNQYYNKADHDSLDMFDTDFTVTAYVRCDDATGDPSIFGKGAYNTSGILVQLVAGNMMAYFSKAADVATVTGPAFSLNVYHTVHVIRDSDFARVCVDGTCGTAVDVSTYGIDNATTFVIAAIGAGSNDWRGQIAGVKGTARVLSDDELAYERARIMGLGMGLGTAFVAWDIARSTVAMKTFTAGGAHAINSKMTEVAAGVVRVAGGLLVEGQRTNNILYSEAQDSWSVWKVTITANSTSYPTLWGDTVADILREDATAAVQHQSYRTYGSMTSGEPYRVSLYVKAINRDWIYPAMYRVGPGLVGVFFDLSTGLVGTADAGATNAKIEGFPDGWYRVSFTFTPTATASHDMYISIGESDTVSVFNGLNQDSLVVDRVQVESNMFTTSYCGPTTDAATTCTADDVTMFPVRFTGLPLDGSETMWIDFSQDPSGATITTSDGGYTLTKQGQPVHERTEVFGDYHYFDGNDYYSLADGSGGDDFDPAGSFSVQFIISPEDVSQANYIVNKGWSGDYGWGIAQSNDDIYFFVSVDGAALVDMTKSTVLENDKPALVTCVYDQAATDMYIYVDAFSTETQSSAPASINDSAQAFTIGATASGTAQYEGDLLFLDYEDAALTEAQHDAAYLQLVQDYVLPKSFGGSGEPDKLTISFDVKCNFSDSSDIGDIQRQLEIGGDIGTASSTRNRIIVLFDDDGRAYAYVRDDADADHFAYTAVDAVDWAEWHNYHMVVDFADFSRMDFWVDGDNSGLTWSGRSGTGSFDLVDTKIRIGQDYAGDVSGNCQIKNLQIVPQEIRP
jgi:hypothetical protein